MAYVHPLIGALVALFLSWVATVGLRSRHREPRAVAARATHRRLAPIALVAMIASALGGSASVVLLRDDLTLGRAAHFWTGWVAVALLLGCWLTSKRFASRGLARAIHPWLGVAAVAIVVLGALFGLDLLP